MNGGEIDSIDLSNLAMYLLERRVNEDAEAIGEENDEF
jgi:hypothetical protein